MLETEEHSKPDQPKRRIEMIYWDFKNLTKIIDEFVPAFDDLTDSERKTIWKVKEICHRLETAHLNRLKNLEEIEIHE